VPIKKIRPRRKADGFTSPTFEDIEKKKKTKGVIRGGLSLSYCLLVWGGSERKKRKTVGLFRYLKRWGVIGKTKAFKQAPYFRSEERPPKERN